jgi:hypothetical protein
MPPPPKLLGEGSICTVLIKKLHPQDIIAEKFPNAIATTRLDDLVAIKQATGRRRGGRTTKNAIFFTTESIPGVQFWCAKGFVKVKESCEGEKVFRATTNRRHAVAHDVRENVEVPLTSYELNEDIARVRELGLMVDDDREPAPENVPNVTNRTEMDPTTGLYRGQRWNWDGQCQRKLVKETREKPSFHDGWMPTGRTKILDDFCKFFPIKWFVDVVVAGTSRNLEEAGEPGTDNGEMYTYVGCKLLMATVVGFSQRQFFSAAEFDEEFNPCPYRLAKFMAARRVELIDQHICFTDVQPPAFVDKFWEIRQMFRAWVENMRSFFIASWCTVLDESMSIWTSKYTCPGWVFCPRKPHDKGNEHHTICCSLSGILFDMEMVEGGDRPDELPEPEYSEHGKTAGLLLRLTKSLHNTAKYVVLDSGFCVLKAIVELKKVGVFAGALIKKRRYWPALDAGDAIDSYFDNKQVGDVAAVE